MNDSESTPELDASQLAVLLADYESLREDERNYATSQISVITVLLTTLTLLGGLVFTIHRDVAIPAPILAFAPAIVFVPLLLLLNMGADAVVRSFYTRALERTVRNALDMRNLQYEGRTLPSLSYTELSLALQSLSPRQGTSQPRWTNLRVFVAIVIPIALIVLGGLTGYIAFQVPLAWRSLMIVGYGGGAVALIIQGVRVSTYSRQMFSDCVESLNRRLREPLIPLAPSREKQPSRLVSYLILPRPDDLVKGSFLLMGVLMARFGGEWIPAVSWTDLGSFMVLWFITEILIYQARYQWNDILGRDEDQAAESSEKTNRLPHGEASVTAAWISIAIRIYLAITLAQFHWLVGPWGIRSKPAVFWALLLYPLIAVVYEWIRAWIRRSGSCSPAQRNWLLATVGLGYPARFFIGWIATGTALNLSLLFLIIGLWALGISFVGATWVLNAASYFNFCNGVPVSRDESKNIDAKPQLHAMLTMVTRASLPTETSSSQTPQVSGGDFKFLKDSAVRARCAPWQLGTVVWLMSVGWNAGSIVGLTPSGPELTLLIVSGGASALLLLLSARFPRFAQCVAPILVLLGYIWAFRDRILAFSREPEVLTHSSQFWHRILVFAILLFLATFIYLAFRNVSYNQTRNVLETCVKCVREELLPSIVDIACGDAWPFNGKRPLDEDSPASQSS